MAKKKPAPKPKLPKYQVISQQRRDEDKKTNAFEGLDRKQQKAFEDYNIARLQKKLPRLTVAQWQGIGVKKAQTTGPTAPAQVWDPGEPTPAVSPYMTSEDIMTQAQAQQARDAANADLTYNIQQQAAQTTANIEQNKKDELKNRTNATDSAIGRGVFQSSIRDSDLADISATAATRRQQFTDQFATYWQNAERQRGLVNEAYDRIQSGLNLKSVENAQAVQTANPWIREPGFVNAPAKPATPAKATTPTNANTIKLPLQRPVIEAPKPPKPPQSAKRQTMSASEYKAYKKYKAAKK